MSVYSEKVMDHFMHSRNVGEIDYPETRFRGWNISMLDG
jgi:NifU-like protein involved in Fe-S cluster formation